MTQFWFCIHCLIEGALDFPKETDVWTVVSAVRCDHLAKSSTCARTTGVSGIHLKNDSAEDKEYEQIKLKVKEAHSV